MPERKCHDCTEAHQREWGCTAKRVKQPEEGKPDTKENWSNPAVVPITIEGELVFNCPRQSIKEYPAEWSRLLMFYGYYKDGFLPEPGGVMDQSSSLLEAFRIMSDQNNECDESLMEEKKRKAAQTRNAPRKGRPPPKQK